MLPGRHCDVKITAIILIFIKNMEVWVIPLRLLLLSILTLTTNTAVEQASARSAESPASMAVI